MSEQATKFDEAIAALAANGCHADFQNPGQLRVCLDEPILTGRIWITWRGQWFISTWTPSIYSIPDESDVVSLSVACVTHKFKGTSFRYIPDSIVQQFGLQLLTECETDGFLATFGAPDES